MKYLIKSKYFVIKSDISIIMENMLSYGVCSLAFGFGVVAWQQWKRARSILAQYTALQQSFDALKTVATGKPFDGIFEVHITIDPQENYVALMDYVVACHDHAMKIVYAVSQNRNNQYMLSYFTRKCDDTEVVSGANKVAAELEGRGIKVLRVKVEGHGLHNTPMSLHDYQLIQKYVTQKYGDIAHKPYFEFHVKISEHITQPLDASTIEAALKPYPGSAISYNMCSANRKPLLTVRVYDEGFLAAQQYKDTVLNALKSIGYSFEDKIQQEFSLYDSNPDLDKGWLF